MKKVLLTLFAVLALTMSSKYIAVQADDVDGDEPDAAVENMINEAANELNEMNEFEDEEVNEAVEEGTGAGGGGITQ